MHHTPVEVGGQLVGSVLAFHCVLDMELKEVVIRLDSQCFVPQQSHRHSLAFRREYAIKYGTGKHPKYL